MQVFQNDECDPSPSDYATCFEWFSMLLYWEEAITPNPETDLGEDLYKTDAYISHPKLCGC